MQKSVVKVEKQILYENDILPLSNWITFTLSHKKIAFKTIPIPI